MPLAVATLATQTLGGWSQVLADTSAPIIRHVPVPTIEAGGEAEVGATVSDDTRVESVTLHVGPASGKGDFETEPMTPAGGDRYTGTLSAEGLEPGGRIDYFITATDGINEESRGFEFDPFSVEVVPATTPIVSAQGSVIDAAAGQGDSAASGGSGRTVLYVLGAVVAAGLVAALVGGRDPGDPDRRICCSITVGPGQ